MGLLNSWGASAKFPSIGTRVGGRVVRDAEEMQQRDFDTGAPLTWDDGNPRMQLVVTVDTGEPDEDGDTEKSIYVKGQMLAAVRAACKRVKKFAIEEGDFFAATFVDEEPPPKGKKGYPKKIFEIEFIPADAGSSLLTGGPGDEPEKPATKTAKARKPAPADDDTPPF